MMENDFVISQSKLPLLRQYQPHIYSLFAVGIQVIRTAGHVSPVYGSEVWIRVKSSSPKLSRQQQQQDVQNAKEYILSLVADDEESWAEKVLYRKEQYEVLKTCVNQIETNSRAVVNLRGDEYSVQIHGLPVNRVLAQTCIDHILAGHASRESSPTRETTCIDYNTDASTAGFISRGEMVTNTFRTQPCLSPGADSCYGSSDDGLMELSSFPCPPVPPPRTDKASPREKPAPPSPGTSSSPGCSDSASSSSSDPEIEKIQSDASYLSKVEFGVKLGYSEGQVLSVLQKLGIGAPQNELLSELINLGTCVNTSQGNVVVSKQKVNSAVVEMNKPLVSASETGAQSFRVDSSASDKPEIHVSVPSGRESGQDFDQNPTDNEYRPIVIDGSNVAMSHGNKEVFSCRGIQLAVEWFRKRGCTDITVFVPQWRKESPRQDAPIEDQHILSELEKDRILSFTPARRIGGKRMVCYDDRYVLKLAAETGGIVVSNDNYRDLLAENKDFKKVVDERLLMYSFVRDMFMPPDDPLGRHGPSLENFLRKEPTEPEPMPPPCPYGKKCTYGNKCKYYHAERGKSVTEKLAEHAKQSMQDFKDRSKTAEDKKKGGKKQRQTEKKLLTRTDSVPFREEQAPLPPPRPPRKPTGSPHIDILETQSNENDPEFRAYNDKLSELSKNIPAESMQQKVSVSQDSRPVPGVNVEMSVPPGYSESSLWPPPDVQGKARSSPQLVTGHLALAQTLSDEANREQRQKSLKQQQEELKQDLTRTQHPLAYSPKPDDPDQLLLPLEHQLSVHGQSTDPRMNPRGSPFSPDRGSPFSPDRAFTDPREFGTSLREPADYAVHHGHYYPADTHPFAAYSTTLPEAGSKFGNPVFLSSDDQFVGDRVGLTRTHSATNQARMTLKPPPPPSMNRQNSTSDPVLNQHSHPGLADHGSAAKPSTYGHYQPSVYGQRPSAQAQRYQYAPPTYDPRQGQYSLPTHHGDVTTGTPYYPQSAPPPSMLAPDVRNPPGGGWAPPPQLDTGYPSDAPIPPTDQRFSLYCHLCGIFPERKVRAVMNQFPRELNPQILCAYVLNLQH